MQITQAIMQNVYWYIRYKAYYNIHN